MYTHLLYTLLYTVKECDRLSLVTYDTQVYLDFGLTAMNRANKDRTKAVIGKLCESSCTNLCGGLMKGVYCVCAVPLIEKFLLCMLRVLRVSSEGAEPRDIPLTFTSPKSLLMPELSVSQNSKFLWAHPGP